MSVDKPDPTLEEQVQQIMCAAVARYPWLLRIAELGPEYEPTDADLAELDEMPGEQIEALWTLYAALIESVRLIAADLDSLYAARRASQLRTRAVYTMIVDTAARQSASSTTT